MNKIHPDLNSFIAKYNIQHSSSIDVINTFLKVRVSTEVYRSIKGDTHFGKIATLYEYLSELEKVEQPVVKTPLNIVIADDSSSTEYVSYLNQFYEVKVHKSKDVTNKKDIDLVLFTGGEDVNPIRYGEKIGKHTYINTDRDSKEIDNFHRFKGYSLMIGICRGSQILTILSGGKLIQHVDGHCKDHGIILKSGARYKMTSSHHQMLYPFNLNEEKYDLIAHSEYFQSNTYLNGENEEIKLPTNFLEPEIIYYKNTNALCIQGHPEWNHCEKKTSNMCLNLIDKCLKEFKCSNKKTINSISTIYDTSLTSLLNDLSSIEDDSCDEDETWENETWEENIEEEEEV